MKLYRNNNGTYKLVGYLEDRSTLVTKRFMNYNEWANFAKRVWGYVPKLLLLIVMMQGLIGCGKPLDASVKVVTQPANLTPPASCDLSKLGPGACCIYGWGNMQCNPSVPPIQLPIDQSK